MIITDSAFSTMNSELLKSEIIMLFGGIMQNILDGND